MLRRESERESALTGDDPKTYCTKNPGAGCCKQLLPIMDECEAYFKNDPVPSKLCPSNCAARLRSLAKSLPTSGAKDGVCSSAIQGIAAVELICAVSPDKGYCFEEIGTIGLLLNESHPAPSKVEKAVGAICGPVGTPGGSCFEQITAGQEDIYKLMSTILSVSNPWEGSDDKYPFDDDAAAQQDDDGEPGNPLQLALPTLRGLNLFCNRVKVSPLSAKQPYCMVHLIDNSTVFHNDDAVQPDPSHIINELADPCARSFFASVGNTDPVAVSVSAYGNGKRASDGGLCGLVTGFGEVARNLTDYCASSEGGSSSVFNVLLPAGQQPTCSSQCAAEIKNTLGALQCCGQEMLFESWYLGADPAGSIPSQVRPPMDGWIYRIATTCQIDSGVFQPTCGYG